NGEQLRIICEDSKYDFRLQEIRDIKEILIIKPILVECNFHMLDRSGINFVSLFFYLQIFHCF
ncbi:MOXD2 protein, partial [Pandion haliaetus]|nr:MOXD2 protein [Pandion haliaetus]